MAIIRISGLISRVVFPSLMFVIGFTVGKLHSDFLLVFAKDYSIELPADDAGVAGQADLHDFTVEPVRLDRDSVDETRRAMEERIFGGRRSSLTLSTRNVDAQRLKSHFTGEKVFNLYYQGFFREKSVSIQEIRGQFPEIKRFSWKSLYIRQVKDGNNKLFLYHHGHDGNPFAMKYANAVISGLIARGYDVIVFAMPGTGWNKVEQVWIKTWDGWGYPLPGRQVHELFETIDTGQAHFIKFFLEPVAASLDHAAPAGRYKKILMAGTSGGGWTTTLASALDERIDASFSFAGSLPFFARNYVNELGDTEQFDHAFYRDFPYTLLYELAAASNRKKRMHYQIFNTDDPCCFAKRSVTALERYHRTRPQPAEWDFRIDFVENDKHEIVPQQFFDILNKSESQAAR